MQGVVINDKHFEVIVRQMMRKVMVIDPGDTQFLEGQSIHKRDFTDANDALYGIKVVTDAGDSENLKPGQMVTLRQLKDENSERSNAPDKKLVEVRDAAGHSRAYASGYNPVHRCRRIHSSRRHRSRKRRKSSTKQP